MTPRRAIPAVGKVLEALGPPDLPRPLVTQLVRQHLASLRRAGNVPSFEKIVHDLEAEIIRLGQTRLQPVINGTGIVLHTNFGRAPLSASAVRRVAEIAAGYSNLEYDIASGGRGARAAYLERCSRPRLRERVSHRREQRRGCTRPDRAPFHEEET